MTDYFDTAYYIDIYVGSESNPYQYIEIDNTPVPIHSDTSEYNGYKIVSNNDLKRTQVFTSGIPSLDIRQGLKDIGMRWSCKHQAWHGKLGMNISKIKKVLQEA